MLAFIKSCIDLPVNGCLCGEKYGVTIHKFEDCFWVLWNDLDLAARSIKNAGLGRICSEQELLIGATKGFQEAGTVLTTQLLKLRKEFVE